MGKVESNTPYDDVCRTLTVECDDLVIPLINEVFGEKYSPQDKVVRRANEHFLEQQGGAEEKRVTDMLLEIISKVTKQEKKYHIEYESSSSDGTILIRIFEYAAQIALDDGAVIGEKLVVEFPHSAIMFLRSKKTTPKQMEISVRTPGGETSYYVPALHVRDYTMEDIFRKRLYFLIPFYIFNLESKFSEIEANRDKVEELKKFYVDMMLRLEDAVSIGELTEFSYLEIRDMTNRVVQNLAKNYKNIRKGVGDIMGGKVLVTEVSKARNKGREEEAIAVVENMLRKGKQPEEIAELCNYALVDVKIVQERMLQ